MRLLLFLFLCCVLHAREDNLISLKPVYLAVDSMALDSRGINKIGFLPKGVKLKIIGKLRDNEEFILVRSLSNLQNLSSINQKYFLDDSDGVFVVPQINISTDDAVFLYERDLYDTNCTACHNRAPLSLKTISQWQETLRTMHNFIDLNKFDYERLQTYILAHSKDGYM